MHASEGLRIIGTVEISAFEGGDLVHYERTKNLFVDTGKAALCALLAGSAVLPGTPGLGSIVVPLTGSQARLNAISEPFPVARLLQFGTRSNPPQASDGSTGDGSLGSNPLEVSAILPVSYGFPEDGKVSFSAVLGPGINTGMVFTEAALLGLKQTAPVQYTMFAHTIFGAYTKTSTGTLQIQWTIHFANV